MCSIIINYKLQLSVWLRLFGIEHLEKSCDWDWRWRFRTEWQIWLGDLDYSIAYADSHLIFLRTQIHLTIRLNSFFLSAEILVFTTTSIVLGLIIGFGWLRKPKYRPSILKFRYLAETKTSILVRFRSKISVNRNFVTSLEIIILDRCMNYTRIRAMAIIEDDVVARDLPCWNLLTRTNRSYQFAHPKLDNLKPNTFIYRLSQKKVRKYCTIMLQ